MEPHEELEEKFSNWLGIPKWHCVSVASGTAALHLACEVAKAVYRLHPAPVCLMQDLAMVACARAAAAAGFTLQFVDCTDDLLFDHESTRYGDIKMVVHLYGRRCDMEKIVNDRTPIIEDLAEAHGINPHPGSFAACWSFYKNKIVHGEEGGMVAFRNKDSADLARSLRSLGFTQDHDFMHIPRGMNYRMSTVHADLIIDSFDDVEENLLYREYLSEIYDKYIPENWRMPKRSVNWVYDIRVPGLTTPVQNHIVNALKLKGIQARHCFKPMTIQPEFSNRQPVSPNALRLSQEVIYLPIHESMDQEHVVTNADTFVKICRGFGIHPEMTK